MSVLFTALINVSLLAETLCAVLSLHSLQSPLEMSVIELAQRMSWLWLVGSRGSYKWWVKGSGISNTSVFDFMKASSCLEKWGCELLFYCSMGLCEVRGRPRFSRPNLAKTGPHADCSRQCWSSIMKDTWFDCHLPHSIPKLNFCDAFSVPQKYWYRFCTVGSMFQFICRDLTHH